MPLCDSPLRKMNRSSPRRTGSSRTGLRRWLGPFAIFVSLLVLGALALAGPYGVLEWGRQNALLDEREAQIATLEEQRAELNNRVELLDRDNADPDLVTELLRRDLNVAHPDEYVIEMKPEN
jgi:cell division protein FtsB